MSKAQDFRVLLIRSGRTEWDEQDRVAGSADLPLSPASRDGLAASAPTYAAAELNLILSAPDEASVQTASIVGSHAGVKVRRVADLAEPSLGLWEGLRGQTLMERHPTIFRQWCEDPASVSPPSGEAIEDAKRRILGGLVGALGRAKSDHPSVGVVVRPVARALIRGWLSGAAGQVWDQATAGRDSEWHLVDRARLAEVDEPVTA